VRLINEDVRLLFDALHVGVVVLDTEDRIVLFNRMAGQMLSEDASSRLGSSILRCHPERAEAGVKKMIGDLKSGELREYSGWVNYRGRIFWEHIYPIRRNSGEYVATVMELHDGAAKARLLEQEGKSEMPEMHGLGESSPRTPFPSLMPDEK